MFEVEIDPPDKGGADTLAPGYGGDPFSEHAKRALSSRGIRKLQVKTTFPPPPTLAAPAHIPDNVLSAFLDGLRAFDAKLYPSAAERVRAALERAVRSLVPDGNDGLKARIKRLDGKHAVPPAMIDLAHTVRAEGNVAVHEEEWTADDAQKLIEFARLLFIYVFTLPAQVAAVEADRGKAAADR